MLFQETEPTEAQVQHKERCEKFAATTAERIRREKDSLFSLLPHEELARIVSGWYEGCEQSMLRGNSGPISDWIRSQFDKVAAEGFAREDLIQLLETCRSSALEVEKWKEELFLDFDEVIQEELSASRTWAHVPASHDGSREKKYGHRRTADGKSAKRRAERRAFARNLLQLPILVKRTDDSGPNEINKTQNISKSGLFFISQESYELDQELKVTYPYWNKPGSINVEYTARVTRLDELPGELLGVSLHFLDSLGRKRK